MSIIDGLLFLITVLVVYGVVFRKKKMHEMLIPLGLNMLVILLHVVFDVVRWQVIFLYTLPLVIFVYYMVTLIEFEKIRKYALGFLSIIIVLTQLIALFFTVLLPVPSLKAPDGPYVVGTTTTNVIDINRMDIYDDSSRNRDIRLQIWYPGQSKGDEPVNWFIDGQSTLKVFSEVYGFPKFFMNHLTNIKSHSYDNIPVFIGDDQYPVIILSHGWSSIRNMHTNIGEELASQGYVVIAIDHTYAAAVTRLNDGSIAKHKSDILPETDFLDEAKTMIEEFSKDIDLVINTLESLNDSHQVLKGQMDLNKVGLLGHSTGAGADVYYALNHPVQAVVGMDPWVEPFEVTNHLDMPSLFFRSEEWSDGPNNVQLKNLTDEVYQIAGSKHQDFTMAYELSPYLKVLGMGGGDTSVLQTKMIVEFFDATLKDQTNDMESLLMDYKNVELKEIN